MGDPRNEPPRVFNIFMEEFLAGVFIESLVVVAFGDKASSRFILDPIVI